MKVTALVENTTANKSLKTQHGLSLYIETANHKMLVDLGNKDIFLQNADKLNIDISAVDTAVITHGHYDHGGGLKNFLSANCKAKVYIQKAAFEPKRLNLLGGIVNINIGLDKSLQQHPQVELVDGGKKIDDEILLLTNSAGEELLPKAKGMQTKSENGFIADNFVHEQSVVLTCSNKTILISGCSHKGIINILEMAQSKIDRPIDFCIGGFHLFTMRNTQTIYDTAKKLNQTNTVFYTCHCTGKKAYNTMKLNMNDKLNYLAAGQTVEF